MWVFLAFLLYFPPWVMFDVTKAEFVMCNKLWWLFSTSDTNMKTMLLQIKLRDLCSRMNTFLPAAAALCTWERKTVDRVWTQFFWLYPEVVSENGFCCTNDEEEISAFTRVSCFHQYRLEPIETSDICRVIWPGSECRFYQFPLQPKVWC